MSNNVANNPQLTNVPIVPTTGSTSSDDGVDSSGGSAGTAATNPIDGTKYVVGTGAAQQFEAQQPTSTISSEDKEGVPLPDPAGPSTSNGQAAQQTVGWLQQGKPLSLAQAVTLLSGVESDQMIQYGRMKNLYGNNEVTMQKDAAQQTLNQVQGERESAGIKFAGSIVAAGLSAVIGYKGGKYMMTNDQNNLKWGGMLTALGQTIGQVVNSSTDAIDKLMGGSYKADQAKIQKSIDDIFVSMYKTQQDNFNNGYEDKRKNLQSVFDMMRQVADANNQTIMNVANNV